MTRLISMREAYIYVPTLCFFQYINIKKKGLGLENSLKDNELVTVQ